MRSIGSQLRLSVVLPTHIPYTNTTRTLAPAHSYMHTSAHALAYIHTHTHAAQRRVFPCRTQSPRGTSGHSINCTVRSAQPIGNVPVSVCLFSSSLQCTDDQWACVPAGGDGMGQGDARLTCMVNQARILAPRLDAAVTVSMSCHTDLDLPDQACSRRIAHGLRYWGHGARQRVDIVTAVRSPPAEQWMARGAAEEAGEWQKEPEKGKGDGNGDTCLVVTT